MICEVCCHVVLPFLDEIRANGTARRRQYICGWCGNNGEQWDSLQPGKAVIKTGKGSQANGCPQILRSPGKGKRTDQ